MKCFIDTEPTAPYVDAGISLWQPHNHGLREFHYIVASDSHEIFFDYGCANFQDIGRSAQNAAFDLFEYHIQGIDSFLAYNAQVDLKWMLTGYREVGRNTPETFAVPWLEFSDTIGLHFTHWPTLSAAYFCVFGEDFKDVHTARADVHAMFRLHQFLTTTG